MLFSIKGKAGFGRYCLQVGIIFVFMVGFLFGSLALAVKTTVPESHQTSGDEPVSFGTLDQIDVDRKDGTSFIEVTSFTEELLEERVELPYDTFKQPDNKLTRGQQRVLKPGQNGVMINKIRVIKADGVEISREVVNSRVLVKPEKNVIAYGISDNIALASRGIQDNVKTVMTMEATAYTHTGNRTATGIYPYKGVIAVDPRVIPLGSKLFVTGYGYCEAQDTGGAIKGDRIDIFLDTREECIQWGRKVVQVYLLE